MVNIKKIKAKMAYWHMCNIISKRPLDINIETITFCPLSCKFCCNRLYKREMQVMSNELFEKIIAQYCEIGGGVLGIGSMQSDFMSDPKLLERIEIIKKYKKHLWIHSTTPLISAAKFNDKELSSILECFNSLEVSAEGYDKKSYQEMSGVDGFEVFYEQIHRVQRIIERNTLELDLQISFRTYEKEKLLQSEFYALISNMFHVREVRDSFFSWFGSIKSQDLPEGAKVHLSNNTDKRVDCVASNATLAIQANGKVVGCGCIDWLEKYCVGDVNNNTLTTLQNLFHQ